MRVGIIDLLSMPASHWVEVPYRFLMTKQYASLMPQAIAVWCRQLVHEVFYATYYGYGDPTEALPPDLDVLFVSSFTQVRPLAYALARLYAKANTLTVIGGPHAKAFPDDCLRFFDLVVKECDKELVADILAHSFDKKTLISSSHPLQDIPTVEERMPYLRQSVFLRGRRYPATTIPLLASTGCPYSCDFCIDWNSAYRPLPTDQLETDLRYIAKHLPGVRITFHDPNLATGWDTVLAVLEKIPSGSRSPCIVESSLASLKKEERLRRLRDTRCSFIGVGIESWRGYSGKAGAGSLQGAAKVPRVVEEFRLLSEYVPYLQANFVFGLDMDEGEEPVEATKEFMSQTPFVWPAVNIPQPFGNTPLFTQWRKEGRLLKTMPFYFYQMPYLVSLPKHYDPMEYYEKVIELQAHATSGEMLRKRLASTRRWDVRALNIIRTLNIRNILPFFRKRLEDWRRDPQFLAFHRGETDVLPAAHERILQRSLGNLSTLLSRSDLTPLLPACG